MMNKKQTKVAMFMYFLRIYRWQTLFLLCVQFLIGFLDGIGIMALLPLISIITDGLGSEQSQMAALVSKAFAIIGLELTLKNVLGGILVIFSAKAVLSYLCALYTSNLSARIVYDFRLRFLDALLHSRWSFYTHQPVGRFLNALISESQRSGGNFKSLADIMAALIQIVILLVIAAFSSWQVVALGAGASFFLWFALFRFIRITGKTGIEQKDLAISINAQIADILQNFKPLKAMNIEDTVFKKVKTNVYDLSQIAEKQMLAKQSLGIFHEPLFVAIMCIGLYGAIEVMGMETSMLMVMAALFYRIITAAKSFQQSYQVLCGKESFFWSLQDFINEAKADAEIYDQSKIQKKLEHKVSFHDVNFSYGDKKIIDSLNLTLPSHKLIGILGPSGTGKTTVIDLLCGLYSPQKGEIKIDDVPLSAVDIKAWRKTIGYVPQEFVIFNDTILHNITLGDPEISREDAIDALKKAEAWDFIQKMPGALDENLGERGGRLSGGQRQRISIARALARQPTLLILDEATASLDPVTERDIFETLKKLAKTTTIIAISHQDTMKQAADIVIDLGALKSKVEPSNQQ